MSLQRGLLQLFVHDRSPSSSQAIASLRSLHRAWLAGRFELVIIDVDLQPELAEEARVWVTPTLIRKSPGPELRLFGDFSDQGSVLRQLEA